MCVNCTVAYQGSRGSFSELALKIFFGDSVVSYSHENFTKVFEAVQSHECTYGIIPIENTLIGTIYTCFDNFPNFPSVAIVDEIAIKIEHALIGFAGAQLTQIKNVYSQLPGLEQCTRFLSHHDWHLVPFKDTAAAVQHVATSNDIHNAAIASEYAAKINKLNILVNNIEDNPHNFTRFAILKKKNGDSLQKGATKGFVLFSTPDVPGALLRCLQVFDNNEINLHKIESRPVHGKPWEYRFVVELDCSKARHNVVKALGEFTLVANSPHVIGFYKGSLDYKK